MNKEDGETKGISLLSVVVCSYLKRFEYFIYAKYDLPLNLTSHLQASAYKADRQYCSQTPLSECSKSSTFID